MCNPKRFGFVVTLILSSILYASSMMSQTLSGKQQSTRAQEASISRGNPAVARARENPVLVSVKGGASLTADLIGPDPGDTDAIILELLGVRRSFKLDEVTINQEPLKFDEYGDIKSNDLKARLDNFAIQLQNTPDASGYIFSYGKCIGQATTRAAQARDYLVNGRGIDSGRLHTIDGGCRSEIKVALWVVPSGATPPSASAEGVLDRCPSCRPKKKPVKRRRR